MKKTNGYTSDQQPAGMYATNWPTRRYAIDAPCIPTKMCENGPVVVACAIGLHQKRFHHVQDSHTKDVLLDLLLTDAIADAFRVAFTREPTERSLRKYL